MTRQPVQDLYTRKAKLYQAFLGFTLFSFRRWRIQRTTFLDFLFALLVYLLLILSPAALQRYNRIRAYRAIRILAKKEIFPHEAV